MPTISVDVIRSAALQLSEQERTQLAAELLESLPPPAEMSDREFDELLARRLADIAAGRAVLIPSEEAWKMIEADE